MIAVRRSPTAQGNVRFSGLPAGHHARHRPRPPWRQPSATVTASRGAFTDPRPFAPHNARVYRFPLAP